MMRVFCLEDDPCSFRIVDYLEHLGFIVDAVLELHSAVYRLEYTPGADEYDFFLFDLSVPSATVKHKDGKTVTYQGPLPGLDFILQNKKTLLPFAEQRKVAIVTGHPNVATEIMRRTGIDTSYINLVHIIGKGEDNFLDAILNFLQVGLSRKD